MPEAVKIILVFLFMAVILFYSRKYRATQMIKARDTIIKDLKNQGALDVESAVELPYAKRHILRVGLRDDRPRVLKQMLQYGIVCMSEQGRFYLNESAIPPEMRE